MGRLANQLWQVVMTYLARRWLVVGTAAVVTVLVFAGLTVHASSPTDRPLSVVLVGCPILSILLLEHAKAQFAHPRAAVMPNFAGPHLAVLASLLMLLLLAYPLLMAHWMDWSPLGLVAFASAVAIAIVWAIHLNRGPWASVFALVSLAVFFTGLTPLGLQWWALPDEAPFPLHVLIVLVGWTAAGAWLWRLSQLREEMDDYEMPIASRSIKPSRAESAAQRSLVARHYTRNRLAAAVVDWWHARRRGGECSSLRGRVRLLEYGLSAWPVEVSSVVWTCVFLSVGILGAELLPQPLLRVLYFYLAWMVLLLTGWLPMAKLAEHRRQMAGELMFPMTRVQLIDGVFAAVARHIAVLWIALHVAALLLVMLFPHQSVTPPVVVTLVLFSASLMMVTFGLGAYFATWSSTLLAIGGFALCWVPIFGLFAVWVWLGEHLGAAPIVSLTLLQLIVGLAIVRAARTKWLSLELG